MIDSKQASAALTEIDDIVRRVRQSTICDLASLMAILRGATTFAGYLATYLSPRTAGYSWIAVYVLGIAGSVAISVSQHARSGVRTVDIRIFVAFVLFIAFGMFVNWLGHFMPRQQGTFWPIYYMLIDTMVGLWIGWAFVVIGLGITAATLLGYFFAGAWFNLWMAVVNGGGLILGGLRMRRS